MRIMPGIIVATLGVALIGCGGGDRNSGSSDGQSSTPSNGSTANGDTGGGGTDSSGSEEEISTEGWGHLKGRFVVKDAPEPAKTTITGDDLAYCGKFELVDQTVVAGADGGLANVVVMLYVKRSDEPPTPHEQYEADAEQQITLNNFMCSFAPHVTLLRTSQKLEIKNSDAVGHNTNIASQYHRVNPLIAPKKSLNEEFTEAERLPVKVTCNIHPWMKGWLVIQDTPYMAITNEKGEFMIENLPAGKHSFRVWHEAGNFLQNVEVDGKPTEWSRGLVDVVIKDQETADLGEVTISYSALSGS